MTEAGVPVFNTPGANANSVKEMVLCGLLLASRGVVEGINHVNTKIVPESTDGHKQIAARIEKDKKQVRAEIAPRSRRDRAEIAPRAYAEFVGCEIAPRSRRDRATCSYQSYSHSHARAVRRWRDRG